MERGTSRGDGSEDFFKKNMAAVEKKALAGARGAGVVSSPLSPPSASLAKKVVVADGKIGPLRASDLGAVGDDNDGADVSR